MSYLDIFIENYRGQAAKPLLQNIARVSWFDRRR